MNNSVGFIGLGRMGMAVCKKLISSGITLHVHNRTKDKAAELLTIGAIWATDVHSLAKAVNVVFVCTTGSEATDLLYRAPNHGLLSCLTKGSIVIDLSTIAPEEAARLHASFREHGLLYVECPVSGGVEGVEDGSLSAIISAHAEAFQKAKPLLEIFCRSITYVIEPGKAQNLKILNNLAESINLAGAIEVITLGRAWGLDLHSMANVFKTCRGRSAYMDVALKYALSDGDSSNVSLAVRCKDLNLLENYKIDNARYTFSALAISKFHSARERFGSDADQCVYFSLLSFEV